MASPLAAPGPWDLVASAYSAEQVPQLAHFSREALRLAEVRPPAAIVDVACGPGTLASLAAAAGLSVSALDFSPGMIAELRARIDAEGASARVEAVVGDGMALPFEEASFDAGFSMFGLMFFPDRDRGFRELLRVVKPGAPVIVSSFPPLERFELLAAALAAMAEVLPPPPSATPFKPPLATREECASEMQKAGFREVCVHDVTYEAPAGTVEDFWAMMSRSSAPLALRKAAMGERWNDVSSAVVERLRAKLGAGAVAASMPAFLTFGRR